MPGDPEAGGSGTPGPPESAADQLEELLLGGRRRYTRLEVAARAGMPPERTQRLWRALGFADVADDDPAFTDADIAALARLGALIESGFVGPDTEASIARAMGQALSRLADWQTDMLAAALPPAGADPGGPGPADPAGPPDPADPAGPAGPADRGNRGGDVRAAVAAAQLLLPVMRELQDYVWRRHLAANAGRLFLAEPGRVDRRELAVGFADLVGYTTRARGMGGRELGRMVEDFESLAADVIARHRGRVVKTVGDGVLFTCVSPVDAVEIGLRLPVEWDAEDRPHLRVGAAYGTVLTRLGDVYSPVVNLASRLTSIARHSTVLVDEILAQQLRGIRDYRVRPLRRVSVRGYDDLQAWLVRRRTPAGEDGVPAIEELLDEIADDVLHRPPAPPAGEDPAAG